MARQISPGFLPASSTEEVAVNCNGPERRKEHHVVVHFRHQDSDILTLLQEDVDLP
jgi:hypothetical protein